MRIVQIVSLQFLLVIISSYGMMQKIEDFAYPPVMCSGEHNIHELRSCLNNIDIDNWKKCIKVDPTIAYHELEIIDRPGVCYDYAMKKLLAGYHIQQKIITPGCQLWVKVLPYFFKQIRPEKIKKGDLAVYFARGNILVQKHFGLVDNPVVPIIEGKWGTLKAVFWHHIFSLPLAWGDGLVYFRLHKKYRVPGVLQNAFIVHLKSVLQHPIKIRQVLLSKKKELLNLAAVKSHTLESLRVRVIQILEQFSCLSIDVRDEKERTPLMLAIANNNILLVKLFLDYGADLTVKDMYGKTPLMLVKELGFIEIEQLLESKS